MLDSLSIFVHLSICVSLFSHFFYIFKFENEWVQMTEFVQRCSSTSVIKSVYLLLYTIFTWCV